MKFESFLVALLAAIILAPLFFAFVKSLKVAGPPPGFDVCNTAGTHVYGKTRFAEAAVATPHLLVKKGTSNVQITTSGAADRPVGTVADEVAAGDEVGVYLLGGQATVLMVANGAISVDAPVYTAASGKVSATYTAGSYLVGYALTAATTDGDTIEVDSVKPVKVAPTIAVATADRAISALETLNPGITVSNAGASGAVTFALPAAVPGMRVDAVVEAAQQLRLDPNGTETIALPSTGVQSAAGAYIVADAIGENVSLVCVTAGTWDCLNFTGTWTAV